MFHKRNAQVTYELGHLTEKRLPRIPTVLVVLALALALQASVPPKASSYKCPETARVAKDNLVALKNRSFPADNPQAFSIDQILQLRSPDAKNPKDRASWAARDRQLEQTAAYAEGYVIAVKHGGPESANCNSREPDMQDLLLYLARSPDAPRSAAVLVEVTPRWRAANPGWSAQNLQRLAAYQTRFRITGWLMFDSNHLGDVGKTRGTPWEIHPVTKIEIYPDRQCTSPSCLLEQ